MLLENGSGDGAQLESFRSVVSFVLILAPKSSNSKSWKVPASGCHYLACMWDLIHSPSFARAPF